MKDEIILEDRLRSAADHFERMAAKTEPEITMQEVAPELAALLRESRRCLPISERVQRELGKGQPQRVARPRDPDPSDWPCLIAPGRWRSPTVADRHIEGSLSNSLGKGVSSAILVIWIGGRYGLSSSPWRP